MVRQETTSATTEKSHLLRSRERYEEDVSLEDPSSTGVKQSCLLNEFDQFYVNTNYASDIMYDLLEGVCGLEVHLAIASLMREGYFDLDTLNSRITSFDYGPIESKNKPSITFQNTWKK
ncbi:hypothetical protein HOLleu_03866 [Holothuria leucospilota]|uniref:Uncharacterized protein n=1 Tax=Holothuria leucospilota TaxID=206669 RepID=A0A9Q1CS64_HOLLE|nr:hypothetical protein HOLleu_03866 [Holothuria leucospilota]